MHSVDSAANRLGLSKSRIYQLIRAGRLAAARLETGRPARRNDSPPYVITEAALEAFAKLQRRPGRPSDRRSKRA